MLIEEESSTYAADNDGDSDEASGLRPLQGVMPRDTDFKQTLWVENNGFSQPACIAGWRSAGTRSLRALCPASPCTLRCGAVRCAADDRQALERLGRYVTRPALANERVQTNAAGQVVLKRKTSWRDGTIHLVMSPLEFMQRLAVRRPRVALPAAWFSPLKDSFVASNRATWRPALGRLPAQANDR